MARSRIKIRLITVYKAAATGYDIETNVILKVMIRRLLVLLLRLSLFTEPLTCRARH